MPSMDSLKRYDFVEDLEAADASGAEDLIRARLGDMAALSEKVPELQSYRNPLQIDWGQALQAFQYNRVQGASLGGGYIWEPGPSFTAVHFNGRVIFGDERVSG